MRWEILILTLPDRKQYLARLMDHLWPQVRKYMDVVSRVRYSDPSLTLGMNRELLRMSSQAEYICFVDDDDMVVDDYVDTIYPLLNRDYVGFNVEYTVDGKTQKPTLHSLKYRGWWEDDKGYYRDISHLNPMRRELAMECSMEGGPGEDSRWADAMRTLGHVKEEHYIDRNMYRYLYRSNK